MQQQVSLLISDWCCGHLTANLRAHRCVALKMNCGQMQCMCIVIWRLVQTYLAVKGNGRWLSDWFIACSESCIQHHHVSQRSRPPTALNQPPVWDSEDIKLMSSQQEWDNFTCPHFTWYSKGFCIDLMHKKIIELRRNRTSTEAVWRRGEQLNLEHRTSIQATQHLSASSVWAQAEAILMQAQGFEWDISICPALKLKDSALEER